MIGHRWHRCVGARFLVSNHLPYLGCFLGSPFDKIMGLLSASTFSTWSFCLRKCPSLRPWDDSWGRAWISSLEAQGKGGMMVTQSFPSRGDWMGWQDVTDWQTQIESWPWHALLWPPAARSQKSCVAFSSQRDVLTIHFKRKKRNMRKTSLVNDK